MAESDFNSRAISGTKGSSARHTQRRSGSPPTREGGGGLGLGGSVRDAPGFGSVNNEHTESSTFEMVNAGLHWLCRMSRQMLPLLFTLQW